MIPENIHRLSIPSLVFAASFFALVSNTAAIEEAGPADARKPIDPELAIKQFSAPSNFKISLFAAEPQLRNPVAFCFDSQGGVYVAETFRYQTTVVDIRGYMNMYDDDLACKSVEDRVALLHKHFGDRFQSFKDGAEIIQKLESRDGTGRADYSAVYADGFNSVLDGIGAGVMEHKGKVYYTCIPDFWLLEDRAHAGKATSKTSLAHGFGVRFGFTGHDLHGLRMGPDGKIYFSLGDRGMNVTNMEGNVLAYPQTGGVIRCNQDGSDMEMFASGLRNPQDLAFDDFGNLFTGDNNCDHGDAARIVYVAEGGDSGWRCANQFSETTAAGVWNSEKLWALQYPEQAAWILPPIAHVGDGPSGFSHYPGVGFPESYKDHFFMCDFRGGSANSGVHSMVFHPKGAGFSIAEEGHFFWGVLATDCQFSPDCQLYVSDWVRGWPQSQLGRIYRLFDPEISKSRIVEETKRILAEGMEKRELDELGKLLAHADQRIRQEAQFEIVDRALRMDIGTKADNKPLQLLLKSATSNTDLLARLHAIWGLGQIARTNKAPLDDILTLAGDKDPEVRAQTAKIFGDAKFTGAFPALTNALNDDILRVRYFAAISLGKLGNKDAINPLVAGLRQNGDKDVFLRHALMMGLVGTADKNRLIVLAGDESRAVRMGVLLAMRRLEMPQISSFLHDTDHLIVLEAARAINDLPLNSSLTDLAALINHPTADQPLDWRMINANFRVGEPGNALQLAAFATNSSASPFLRSEAVHALANWKKPGFRDRITGLPQPLTGRPAMAAVSALSPQLETLIDHAPQEVANATLEAVQSLEITTANDIILAAAVNKKLDRKIRIQAIKTLAVLDTNKIPELVKMSTTDESEHIRSAGYWLEAKSNPQSAAEKFKLALENGTTIEKQTLLDTIGSLESADTDSIIGGMLDKLIKGTLPHEIELELVEAARKRSSPEIASKLKKFERTISKNDGLAEYHDTLHGGNAASGEAIFRERQDVACNRCHKVNGSGGNVGPDLTGIITRRDRNYLLESIIYPNKQIAEGFENLSVVLKNGRSVSGIVRKKTDSDITLYSSEENEEFTVKKSDIQTQNSGLSPMPEGLNRMLSNRELRDLIEFLATTKAP